MARLAIAVRRDFPQFFGFFGTKSFRWKGQRFGNHNKLLANYAGTDGIKTGYINASGFNLVATVERAGVRLIGVVFGGRTGRTRDAHMVEILDKSFKRVKPADIRTQLASAGSGKVTALPKTLPVPPPAPGAPPVAPPPRRVRRGSSDVALAGDAASLDGAPAHAGCQGARHAEPVERADRQLRQARQRAPGRRTGAPRRRRRAVLAPARLTMVTRGNIPLWRVRFHNLDETQARSACAALFAKGRPCMAIEEGDRRAG